MIPFSFIQQQIFFLIQISSIFGIRNRKLCHTVESWNIIYEEDSHRGESPRLLIKYFIVIIDSLTNTTSYVTTANGFKRENCKRIEMVYICKDGSVR